MKNFKNYITQAQIGRSGGLKIIIHRPRDCNATISIWTRPSGYVTVIIVASYMHVLLVFPHNMKHSMHREKISIKEYLLFIRCGADLLISAGHNSTSFSKHLGEIFYAADTKRPLYTYLVGAR